MEARIYKLAKGMSESSNTIANVKTSWPRLVEIFSTHKQSDTKFGEYIVGGQFKGTVRDEKEMVCRSVVTLDIDDYQGSIESLEMDLIMGIDGAFLAYSTFSHTPESPRVRVVVPLSRDVTPSEYREVSRDVAASLGLSVDPCSYTPNQAMFYPKASDLSTVFTLSQDGEPYAVPDVIENVFEEAFDDDDLSIAVATQPLDLTDEAIDAYLAALPSEGLPYETWFKVGAGIAHQTGGSDEGYQKWFKWSEQSSKHDPKQMRKKWDSIDFERTRPITFASVIAMVRDGGSEGAVIVAPIASRVKLFEELALRASEIDTLDAYTKLKNEIKGLPDLVLARDERAMIAAEIMTAFGDDAGLTKSEIKRELAASQKKRHNGDQTEVPSWAKDWVYLEVPCEFANTVKNYSIKREAFNAKYGREPEVVAAELPATELVLHGFQIPLLVDSIYWPSKGRVLTDQQGRDMLNTYSPSGIAPCDIMDCDGQLVVDMFLKHVELLLNDPVEQTILLDFMTHTVKCPGDKINWAILMHGPEGVGKSYLSIIMEMILGDNFKSLTPSAISGRFTSWGTGSVLNVIEEIHVSGESRYEIMDKLKPFISNEVIQIEEKGRDVRTVPNFSNYMAFTNRKDAVPITDGDRRYTVMETSITSEAHLYELLGGAVEAQNYFAYLFDESRRRADALHRFFLDRKCSDSFNPKGRAPITAAKLRMVEISRSPERLALEDAIEQYRCPIINDRVIDITWLNKLIAMECGEALPQTRLLSKVLLEMGYTPIDGKRVKIVKTNAAHYVWEKSGGDLSRAKELVRDFHSGDLDVVPF